MFRRALLVSLVLAAAAPAQRRDSLDKALPQFEEHLKKVVRDAEPAIVSVLVSRSDAYARLGAGPPPDGNPGRLGDFDARRLLRGDPDEERKALVRRFDLSRPENVPETHGSGIVLDASGLVLTNNHVVRDAAKVYVRLPGGRGSYADIHAADPRSDFAVLKLLAPPPGLTALPLGRAEDVAKGQFVLALANPFVPGFRDARPSASWGIVGNVRYWPTPRERESPDRGGIMHRHYGTLLQADVGMNLGVSGGALLNLKGELIGVTGPRGVLVGPADAGGFAVALAAPMRRIIGRLSEGREVEYGYLGITFEAAAAGRLPGGGVRIGNVTLNTPAAEVNLPAGHIIRGINEQPVNDTDDLSLAISTALAGSTVTLKVCEVPNGPVREYRPVLAKLAIPGTFLAARRPPAPGGLRVDYTTTLLRGANDPRVQRGVVVREVLPGGAAEKANVQVGRVITQVNNDDVANPAEFYRKAARAGAALELTFSNNEKVTLPLR